MKSNRYARALSFLMIFALAFTMMLTGLGSEELHAWADDEEELVVTAGQPLVFEMNGATNNHFISFYNTDGYGFYDVGIEILECSEGVEGACAIIWEGGSTRSIRFEAKPDKPFMKTTSLLQLHLYNAEENEFQFFLDTPYTWDDPEAADCYAKIRLTVDPTRTMRNCKVTFDQDPYLYSGTPVTPAPKVTFLGETLTEGEDYIMEYYDNDGPGEATVTLRGRGTFLREDYRDEEEDWYFGLSYQHVPFNIEFDPEAAVDEDTFNEFFKVAGWYSHEWMAGDTEFHFSVPCGQFAQETGKAFTKEDLDKIDITLTTADGTVYEPIVSEDPYYPGDYIYTYNTPEQEWGAPYTITFRNLDKVKTIKGAVKKEVPLKYTVGTLAYTGSKLTPKITIKDGDTVLKEGTDYTLSSDLGPLNIKNVGMYGIYIDSPLTSKYLIHDTQLITVNPKATSLKSVTAVKKGFTAKWAKRTEQVTGYQIQYSTSSTFKTGVKSIWVSKNTTTSKKKTGLKAKKKYYVRIRTYKTVNGNKYYSAWSAKKTVTTKK